MAFRDLIRRARPAGPFCHDGTGNGLGGNKDRWTLKAGCRNEPACGL